MLLFLSSCGEKKDYSSVAKRVGEHVETEVIQHPSWIYNASIVSLSQDLWEHEDSYDSLLSVLRPMKESGFSVIVLPPLYDYHLAIDSNSFKAEQLVFNFEKTHSSLSAFRLQNLINKAQQEGIKVIMSWQAERLQSSHPWLGKHPEWFEQDSALLPITHQVEGKSYVHLQQGNAVLREQLKAYLSAWILRYNLDGIHCSEVNPDIQLWEELRAELPEDKDLFFYASNNKRELMDKAFNAVETERWGAWNAGLSPAKHLEFLLEGEESAYIRNDILLRVIKNDSCNTKKQSVLSALSFTALMPGLMQWHLKSECLLSANHGLSDKNFVQALQRVLDYKKTEKALWTGYYASEAEVMAIENSALVLMRRTSTEGEWLMLLNLSEEEQTLYGLEEQDYEYDCVFDNRSLEAYQLGKASLKPNELILFSRSYRKL